MLEISLNVKQTGDRWHWTGWEEWKVKQQRGSSLQWRPRKQCTSKAGSLKDKFIQKSKIQALYTYPMEMPLKLCFANIAWRWVDVFICGWTSGGSWEHPVFNWFSHLTWPDSFISKGDHFFLNVLTKWWRKIENTQWTRIFYELQKKRPRPKKPHIALHDI